MKKIFVILFVLSYIHCSSPTIVETENPVIDNPISPVEDPQNNGGNYDYSILFIGNSLTYSNNLPKLFSDFAQRKGLNIYTKMVANANYAIIDHWADGEIQNLIRSKKYNFVVIQQGPSSQQNGYDMLVNDGKLYADICEQNNAKLAYFMVWPSRMYYYTFDGVIANYTAGAKANNAILCPVGKIWKAHFDATNDFSYYGSDQFHPSLKGSRVAAEIIFNSLGL